MQETILWQKKNLKVQMIPHQKTLWKIRIFYLRLHRSEDAGKKVNRKLRRQGGKKICTWIYFAK